MNEIDDFVQERCKFCDTPLVLKPKEGESLLHFTKHDDDFCKTMMHATIEMQQKIIESLKIENAMYQHSFHRAIRGEHGTDAARAVSLSSYVCHRCDAAHYISEGCPQS